MSDLMGSDAAGLLAVHAPVIVGLVDQSERIVDLGGPLLAKLGYDRIEWVGRPMADILNVESITALIRRGLAGESLAESVDVNGRLWLVACEPQRDAAGRVTGVLSVLSFADQVEIRSALLERQIDVSRFEALVSTSADFISMADEATGRISYLNPAGAAMVGLGTDPDLGDLHVSDFLPPADSALGTAISAAVETTGRWSGESELVDLATGERIPVSANVFVVTSPLGPGQGAVATVQRDQRGRVESDRAVARRAREQRTAADFARLALSLPLAELLQAAADVVADHFGDVMCAIVQPMGDGMNQQTIASTEPSWVSAVMPLVPGSLTERAVSSELSQLSTDLTLDDHFTGTEKTIELGLRAMLACPIAGESGTWALILPVSRSAHEWTGHDVAFVESIADTMAAAVHRHGLESQLQHQALHDPLTGLPNRALATDRIAHALRRSGRRSSSLAVLLLDLDDFKTVNDSLGHGSGDALLADLALRFEQVVRDGDTVARLGGDEFVVVCEDLASEQEAVFVAEALLEACAGGVQLDGRHLGLSASVGVTLAHSRDASPTTLLSEADIAMYRAKRDRPGTYRVFDEGMRGDVVGRLNLAGELREALRTGSLDVAYQPIVNLETGRVAAMEALARWTNEAGEVVSPDVFIPLAEQTGLISELGTGVLRAAAAQARQWQSHGEVGVRVNASAHELRYPSYVDQVLATLDEVGLATHLLGIEITESMLVAEEQTTQLNLSRLRAAGITLLIDDFGTGYSSLSYLQRFPVVDVLKVDRSFLREGVGGKAVVEAIVALGRAFGLAVCAEGVETAEQHTMVRELGCHTAQGYLLSEPVPGARTLELLAGWVPYEATAD